MKKKSKYQETSKLESCKNTVKLSDKEHIGVKELFTDYQPFFTINLLLRNFCQSRKWQNLALLNQDFEKKIDDQFWGFTLTRVPKIHDLCILLN